LVVLKIEEQEVKETDSIVQTEAESKEKVKKDFPVWYIALIVGALVVAIGSRIHHQK